MVAMTPANATTFNFNYSDGVVVHSGSGQFFATEEGVTNVYDLTGITGVADGAAITGLSLYAGADNKLYFPGSAPPGLEHELLCGTIGEGVATEMVAFMRVFRDMISPDAILLNPTTAPVPKEPAAACAIAAALAHKATPGNFDRVMTFAQRMPAEYAVLIVKLATHRDMTLCATRAFIAWASANTDIVL